jgi:hypothetical protein
LEVRTKEMTPQDKFELLTPGFTGIVKLTADVSARLRVGQRGVVWLERGEETIAGHLLKTLRSSIPDSFTRQYNLAP